MLHDLIEDTEWTLEQLKIEGFSDEIIAILDCLTKRKNEDYGDFINQIIQNPVATKFKINDLEDNLDIKRLSKIEEKDVERLNKYLNYYHYLKAKIN